MALSAIVEPVIALTILFVAIENILAAQIKAPEDCHRFHVWPDSRNGVLRML